MYFSAISLGYRLKCMEWNRRKYIVYWFPGYLILWHVRTLRSWLIFILDVDRNLICQRYESTVLASEFSANADRNLIDNRSGYDWMSCPIKSRLVIGRIAACATDPPPVALASQNSVVFDQTSSSVEITVPLAAMISTISSLNSTRILSAPTSVYRSIWL